MKSINNISLVLRENAVKPELWEKIQQLNFDLIRSRMVIKYGWSEERTDAAIHSYLKFLFLTQVIDAPVSPTKDIDEIWHQHILHTNKYFADCQYVFGRYLHHLPNPSVKTVHQLAVSTNCSSPCCNHQDCCNDNPVVRKPNLVINENGVLLHADCGDPAPGGCAPIGGSDDYCGGTTNDRLPVPNYDLPILNDKQSILFNEVVSSFFIN